MFIEVTKLFLILPLAYQGREVKVECALRITTDQISDQWDNKLTERASQQLNPKKPQSIEQKQNSVLAVDESLNQTLPYVEFLKMRQKPGSLFEMVSVHISIIPLLGNR